MNIATRVEYQPYYREPEDSSSWYKAGMPVKEATALSMVKSKLDEYTGPNPRKRMTRITTEWLEIETSVKFKETK